MRNIEHIVIHCAATPNGRHFTVEDIDSWHVERGFRRGMMRLTHRPHLKAIGYHEVIYTDGTISCGRHHEEAGAHVAGHNSNSIGVCLIGTDKFTPLQWEALALLHKSLLEMYPDAKTLGHTDFPGVTKTCPGFSVAEWLANGREALSKHTL